ncbi:MAG: hypothetical protein EAZ32_19240 [Cytophagia bacterium]|nr:MAG: hypothetical protein EAZ46_11315 [Runella sp.]TAG16748.1 MAG: hypothetical protein EAZ38_18430 [Cytophagales bacterium]TAG34754.1 MAG: hypothetical protein EAZ32_19240 [Cytophagia bacterium]TAG76627.1 MAG: hypothetical protein EAZ22_17590 [Cytophagales bacterium]
METRRVIVKMKEGYALSEFLRSDKETLKAESLGHFEKDENFKSHKEPLSIENKVREEEHYNSSFYQKMGKMDKEIYRSFKVDCQSQEDFNSVMNQCENQKEKVESFYEDGHIYFHDLPNDPEFIKTQRKVYEQLGVEECWDFTKGTGQIVAVIDTGVVVNHPDLTENLWKKGSQIGYTYPNTQKMDDSFGHGTGVSGIIAGTGNNGIGIIGTAPEAIIQMHKLQLSGGKTFMSEAITAINVAKQEKIKIVNCSFGVLPNWRNSEAEKKFQHSINQLTDVMLFVFSSGNGTKNNMIGIDISNTFLNEINNVLKVGALNNNSRKASYSNFGDDVVYAFGDIMSTDNRNSYSVFQHTSAAAPQVSGICALLMSYNTNIPIQKVKQAIIDTASSSNKKVNAFKAFKQIQKEFA